MAGSTSTRSRADGMDSRSSRVARYGVRLLVFALGATASAVTPAEPAASAGIGELGTSTVSNAEACANVALFVKPVPPRYNGMDFSDARAERVARHELLLTHLYALAMDWVYLEEFPVAGGAVASLCGELLVATAQGRLALVRRNGRVEYLEGRVPMNLAAMLAHEPPLPHERFRVNDIFVRPRSRTVWELYVTHHYFTGTCVRFRLSATTIHKRGGVVRVAPEWRNVFDAEPCVPDAAHGQQAGGRILADGADHLLVLVGDHGAGYDRIHDPEIPKLDAPYPEGPLPQDARSHFGKLVRVAIATGEAKVLAQGFRAPQGLTRDDNGVIWATEHGPEGGDELNVLKAGNNYGAPYVSYGLHYGNRINTRDRQRAGAHHGYTRPIFSWIPSIGVSALVANDRDIYPLWEDDLLVGSLTGSGGAGHALFRVRRSGTSVRYVERIPVGKRIRDITRMPDGRIALLLDMGSILFLYRATDYCPPDHWSSVYHLHCEALNAQLRAQAPPEQAPAAPITSVDPPPATRTGAQLFASHCANCHHADREKHGVGPHLAGIVGQRIGAVQGYQASAALRAMRSSWTQRKLARFIADPQRFASGTTMASTGLSTEQASAIAAYIAELGNER